MCVMCVVGGGRPMEFLCVLLVGGPVELWLMWGGAGGLWSYGLSVWLGGTYRVMAYMCVAGGGAVELWHVGRGAPMELQLHQWLLFSPGSLESWNAMVYWQTHIMGCLQPSQGLRQCLQ